MPKWIWLISECNLTTRDSRKWTPMGGPFMRERRGSGPEKLQPKHNPCRPVGRNWKEPILWSKPDHMTLGAGKIRHLLTVCLTKVHMMVWDPIGTPTRSMVNMKWYSPSQVLTAKHVPHPQLTATAPNLESVVPREGQLPI